MMDKRYEIDICGVTYTYRLLTVGEYRLAFNTYEDSIDIEDYIVSRCVIDPIIDFDTILYKVPTILCTNILISSKLDSDKEWKSYIDKRTNLLKRKRNADGTVTIGDIVGTAILTISNAFPSMNPIEIGKLTTDEMLELYSLSIYKLGQVEDEMKIPTKIPDNLTAGERQRYKEEIAAAISEKELKKAMEEGRANNNRSMRR